MIFSVIKWIFENENRLFVINLLLSFYSIADRTETRSLLPINPSTKSSKKKMDYNTNQK